MKASIPVKRQSVNLTGDNMPRNLAKDGQAQKSSAVKRQSVALDGANRPRNLARDIQSEESSSTETSLKEINGKRNKNNALSQIGAKEKSGKLQKKIPIATRTQPILSSDDTQINEIKKPASESGNLTEEERENFKEYIDSIAESNFNNAFLRNDSPNPGFIAVVAKARDLATPLVALIKNKNAAFADASEVAKLVHVAGEQENFNAKPFVALASKGFNSLFKEDKPKGVKSSILRKIHSNSMSKSEKLDKKVNLALDRIPDEFKNFLADVVSEVIKSESYKNLQKSDGGEMIQEKRIKDSIIALFTTRGIQSGLVTLDSDQQLEYDRLRFKTDPNTGNFLMVDSPVQDKTQQITVQIRVDRSPKSLNVNERERLAEYDSMTRFGTDLGAYLNCVFGQVGENKISGKLVNGKIIGKGQGAALADKINREVPKRDIKLGMALIEKLVEDVKSRSSEWSRVDFETNFSEMSSKEIGEIQRNMLIGFNPLRQKSDVSGAGNIKADSRVLGNFQRDFGHSEYYFKDAGKTKKLTTIDDFAKFVGPGKANAYSDDFVQKFDGGFDLTKRVSLFACQDLGHFIRNTFLMSEISPIKDSVGRVIRPVESKQKASYTLRKGGSDEIYLSYTGTSKVNHVQLLGDLKKYDLSAESTLRYSAEILITSDNTTITKLKITCDNINHLNLSQQGQRKSVVEI